MDSTMHPVETSTYLGEWIMPNLKYPQETVSLGFSAMYQQGINSLESLKPFPPLEDK